MIEKNNKLLNFPFSISTILLSFLIFCFNVSYCYAEIIELSKAEVVENALDNAEYILKSKKENSVVFKNQKKPSMSGFFNNTIFKERPETTKKQSSVEAKFNVSVGFRNDDFNWNIAADSSGTATPNILSELSWSDIKSRQIKTEGSLLFYKNFLLEGYFAYANTYYGDNQDSDYAGNDRTQEFSRSNNNSSDGHMYDASGGIGYKLNFEEIERYICVQDLALTFLGGYSYHQQYFKMTDGYQTVPDYGAFSGLNSFYKSEWKGPWLGIKMEGGYKSLSTFFQFEYHMADYYGSANWNLRDDFAHPKSYEHISDGSGLVFNIGWEYILTEKWTLGLNVDWQKWEAGSGVDRVFFSDGSTSETRLNEVNWDSYALRLGATYTF